MKSKAKTKRHLIIIARTAEKDDMDFYNIILKQDSLLYKKAVVIMFSSVLQLQDYLLSMPDGYCFSVLIHVGMNTSMSKGKDWKFIIKELEQSELCKTISYELTSREGLEPLEGRKVNYTMDLPDQTNIENLPLNIKINGLISEAGKAVALENSDNGKSTKKNGTAKRKVEFAIITALQDNEYALYKHECTLEKYDAVRNSSWANFKQEIKLSNGKDYRKQFLLLHQDQMGLVDAAVHSTQALNIEKPEFLLMSGVCGGKKTVTNLYDVIIPTEVHDYSTGKFKSGKLETLGYKTIMDRKLVTFLKNSKDQIIHNMRALCDPNRSKLLSKNFDIHIDEFACGPWVVKTDGFLDKYLSRKVSSKIKGLEMESYSVLRAGELMESYAIVAKSVMDFTNELKSDGQHGEVKAGAAYVSYLCVRAMMPLLVKFK